MRTLILMVFLALLVGLLCALKAGSDDDDINRPKD
jgi:hypothetical protein